MGGTHCAERAVVLHRDKLRVVIPYGGRFNCRNQLRSSIDVFLRGAPRKAHRRYIARIFLSLFAQAHLRKEARAEDARQRYRLLQPPLCFGAVEPMPVRVFLVIVSLTFASPWTHLSQRVAGRFCRRSHLSILLAGSLLPSQCETQEPSRARQSNLMGAGVRRPFSGSFRPSYVYTGEQEKTARFLQEVLKNILRVLFELEKHSEDCPVEELLIRFEGARVRNCALALDRQHHGLTAEQALNKVRLNRCPLIGRDVPFYVCGQQFYRWALVDQVSPRLTRYNAKATPR